VDLVQLLGFVLGGLGALALAAAVMSLRRLLRRQRADRCPCCAHPTASESSPVCVECGAGLDPSARRRSRLRWLVWTAAFGGVAALLGMGSAIAFEGYEAVPAFVLVRLADPAAEPTTMGRQASDELTRRISRGQLSDAALTDLLALGLDRAFASPEVFITRKSWPKDTPLALTLRRDTLNGVRGPNNVALHFVGPNGSFKEVTVWGNPNNVRGASKAGSWIDPTIEVPSACDTPNGVAFDIQAIASSGTLLWSKRVEIPSDRSGDLASALVDVDDPAVWEELRDHLEIQVAPIEREGHPKGALIVWFRGPLASLANDLAVGLRVTVESQEVPHLKTSGSCYVRARGRATSPSTMGPLCLEHPDQPKHWGRCTIRIEADPALALRDLAKTRRLTGRIEVERELADPPVAGLPAE
jgi:hypothetical protein